MTATTKLTLEERTAILASLEGEQARAVRELLDEVRGYLANVIRIMGWDVKDFNRSVQSAKN
jgi:hypothetical protein